jgi:hypothetical protein
LKTPYIPTAQAGGFTAKFGKGYQEVSFSKSERYVADATDMASVLRGEKSTDYSFAHDLDVQETVLRASGMSLDA